MASTTLGIWSHQGSDVHALKETASLSSAASNNDTSASSSATVSANDFLTLLVTELQNQDPTATTDPNEYINQLVEVNSLEQLISIDQKLGSASDGSAPPTAQAQTSLDPAPSISAGSSAHHPASIQRAPGSLSFSPTSPAAQRIASALGT